MVQDHAPDGEHRPLLVRWDNRHTIPAEVCGTCSDPDSGRWVPATFCEEALAQMTDDPASLYADNGGVIVRGRQ